LVIRTSICKEKVLGKQELSRRNPDYLDFFICKRIRSDLLPHDSLRIPHSVAFDAHQSIRLPNTRSLGTSTSRTCRSPTQRTLIGERPCRMDHPDLTCVGHQKFKVVTPAPMLRIRRHEPAVAQLILVQFLSIGVAAVWTRNLGKTK
jgi:hypothetical protein